MPSEPEAPVPFTQNPLLPDGPAAGLSWSHGLGPYHNTRRALEALDLSAFRGRRLLLKPNTGRVAAKGSGIVTHPEVVAAAIDVFREAGATVAIGESPIIGVNTHEAYEACGLTESARSRDCPLIDMDERPAVPVEIPGGQAIRELKLCADVLDFDALVSIPVMKTHMHTCVTLAVKNMKGCLWRRSKIDLHMLAPVEGSDEKPLNIALADMATILRPHFAIVDGTVGLEGLGPSAGEPKPVDTVLAGFDAFAADALACRVMGIDPRKAPHLRLAEERGLGSLDVDALPIEPAEWQDAITPFEAVPENISIQFPGTEILDQQSCSACQSTLLLFLKRYGEDMFQYFSGDGPIRFAIGKGHETLPEGAVCIGNCTRKHKQQGVFVSGCPPVASEILNALKESSS